MGTVPRVCWHQCAAAVYKDRIVVRSHIPFKGAVETQIPIDVHRIEIDLSPRRDTSDLAAELAKMGLEIVEDGSMTCVKVKAIAFKKGIRVPALGLRYHVSVRVVDPEAWVKGYGEGVMTHHRFLGFGLPIVLGDVPPYQRQ